MQHVNGSGHRLITVDKKLGTARFDAYRLDFAAADPQQEDQIEESPITLPLRQAPRAERCQKSFNYM